ncbi:MAG: thioesterase family protein [Actinomycetia bacterium]|nr:thioesterase family protein [Actinomycetes bacterium]
MDLLQSHLSWFTTAEGVFRRQCDRTWWGTNAMVGGYVQALVVSAMQQANADPEQEILSLHCQFLRPVLEGELRAEVSVVRRGRTLTNLRCELYSQERLAVVALASFAKRSDLGAFAEREAPGFGRVLPAEIPVRPEVGLVAHGHFDLYPRLGGFERGQGDAQVGGWVAPRWDTGCDVRLLAVLADLWVPAAYHRWRDELGVVGLDITVHFRVTAAQLRGLRPMLQLRLSSALADGGYVDEDGEIWSESGQLLCQYRQMRLIL